MDKKYLEGVSDGLGLAAALMSLVGTALEVKKVLEEKRNK